MNVRDFVTAERQCLFSFVLYWLEKLDTHPEDFPAAMDPEDWAEQYQAYKDIMHDQ